MLSKEEPVNPVKESMRLKAVRFGFGRLGHFFKVHSAIRLVIVNAEQSGAVGKLTDAAFSGGF
jgi:hypothetical protein